MDHSARYWLETPAITVPNANSKLEFTHYMQSESLFDGGNIKYALNGSTTWTIVPRAAMTAATGGYNPHSSTFEAATPIGDNTSPNADQRAWTGCGQGVSTGSWGTTIVNFAQFAAATRPAEGNTIKLRYEFAQDGCNGNLGWFVDDVSAFHCVANAIPTASFTSITPSNGESLLNVSFVVAGTDPDAGDSVVSYTLDFGDGSAPVTQTSANFSHTYTAAGEYTPKLTVTDSRGASSTEVVGSVIEVIEAVAEELDIRFVDRVNVKPNTFITSELVTVSGFTGALTVTPDAANGQQVSVHGGAFTSEPVSITAGQKVAVRHVSPEDLGLVKITTLRVGSQEVPFKTTNTTLDHVPDAFDFGKKEGVVACSAVISDEKVLTGYDTPRVVPGSGLSYSVNGGPFTTASSTIECGDVAKTPCNARLRVRHTANASSLGYTQTYLAVGGVRGHFVTRTKK